MLATIHNNMSGIFAKFIMALIIIPFIYSGIDSVFQFNGPATIAKVNGDKLTEVDLGQAIEMQKRRIIASAGEKIDYSLLEDAKLREPALKQIVNQKLIKQFASDQGILISDALVTNSIVGMKQFQENGQFSQLNYENLLGNMGYSPAYFRTLIAQDIAQAQIVNGLITNDFITTEQLGMVAALIAERRTFQYIVIEPDAFSATVNVADGEIASYYKANQDEFIAQEKLKLEYIDVKETDFYKPVADDVLKQAYEKEMVTYKGKDTRHAAHILIEVNDKVSEDQAKAKAQALIKQIKDGAEFSAVAKANSADVGSKDQGGDLGYSAGDVFDPAFEEALAGLKPGELSAPVKTEFGIHVIKLLDQKIEEKPTYDNYKATLAQRIQQQTAAPEFARLSEQLKDITFNSDNLQAPAEKLSLKVVTSDWVDRDAKRNEGLFSDERLLKAAFVDDVLKDGQNSEVVELAPDHLVVMRMSEYQPKETLPLEKVKDSIRTTLIAKKSSAAALAKADEINAQIKSGANLADIAKTNKYLVKSVADKPRQMIEAEPQIVEFAFAQSQQAGVATLAMTDGSALLLATESVKPGNLADFSKAEKDGLITSLKQAQESSDYATILSDLHEQAEINITLK
jgi:peptidyl-prolyl cis-trans isomerase D